MKKLKTSELNRLGVSEFKDAKKLPVVVLLDNIRSMFNIGAIFRTCDAFLVEKIILCGITATPPNREINKTALGATESVKWEYSPSIIDEIKKLQEMKYTVIAVEQTTDSKSLHQFQFLRDNKYALIFGNEVTGISDDNLDYADYAIEIPQYGTKHSLNVSVSVGIVLHWITRVFK